MEPSNRAPFDRVKQAEEYRRLSRQYAVKADALDPPTPRSPGRRRLRTEEAWLVVALVGLIVAVVVTLVAF